MDLDINLVEGSSGNEVILVQQLLRINKYYNGVSTGVYGPDTSIAVKSFQEDNDLDVTGNISGDDLAVLYSLTRPAMSISVLDKPILSLGDSGEDVREVQVILSSLDYYLGVIDGIFSENLEKAVKSFQYVNKLIPDGVVREDTWSALIILYAPLAECVDDGVNTYTVVRGDTLYSIAKKFDISVDELISLNNLESTVLSIGQVLNVSKDEVTPEVDEDIVLYKVVRGDTLYSIARKFGTSVDILKSLNNLVSDTLSIGQELVVSSKDIEEEDGDSYTVVSGDTLYSIARKFGISVDELISYNNLSSTILSLGQVLKIPGGEVFYTVNLGDTLYSIARNFNTSVDELIKKNNLDSTILSVGQVLKI